MAKIVVAHQKSDTEMIRSRFAAKLTDCSVETRPGAKNPDRVTVSTFTTRYAASGDIKQLIYALEQAKKIKVQSQWLGQHAEEAQ